MIANDERMTELMAAMRHEGEWWAPRVPLESALTEIARRADSAVSQVLAFPRFQGTTITRVQGCLLGAIYIHSHARCLLLRFAEATAAQVDVDAKAPTPSGTDTVFCSDHHQPCLMCVAGFFVPHEHRCCLCG